MFPVYLRIEKPFFTKQTSSVNFLLPHSPKPLRRPKDQPRACHDIAPLEGAQSPAISTRLLVIAEKQVFVAPNHVRDPFDHPHPGPRGMPRQNNVADARQLTNVREAVEQHSLARRERR